MSNRGKIIDILKQTGPVIVEGNGPTSIFTDDKDFKKLSISRSSADKDFIIVTTGKFLFKRKYLINRNEL